MDSRFGYRTTMAENVKVEVCTVLRCTKPGLTNKEVRLSDYRSTGQSSTPTPTFTLFPCHRTPPPLQMKSLRSLSSRVATRRTGGAGSTNHVSYILNSFKGEYIGNYIGDYYRGY